MVCSISDILFARTGATFNKSDSTTQQKENYIRVLRGGNISNYSLSFKNDDLFIPLEIVNENIIVKQYDIITPAVTSLENIGKMTCLDFTLKEKVTVGGFVYLLSPILCDNTFAKFIIYQLTSLGYINKLKSIAKKSGAAFYNINKTKLNSLLFLMPPYEEQKRIVTYIENLFKNINIIEDNQVELEQLYDKLKKKTLDLAIQGKLVSQDPNDEPACELLKRIRTEKKAQLGKKYVDSYIYKGDDNCYYEKIGSEIKNITNLIPFYIPENWSWARLGYIIDFSKNAAVSSNDINDNDWILDLEDIEKASGKLLCKKRMIEVKSKSDKHKFFIGNVLYSKLRPYLNKVIIADECGYCTTEILAFDFGNNLLNRYAQIYLMSPYFVNYAMAGAYGVKMPRIGSERGNNAFIPVPPLAEQKRIALAYHTIVSKLKDEI